MVNSRVLPGECIYVFIVELRMLVELIVVVDAALAVLIEHGRKREVRAQVDNGALVRFGTKLDWDRMLDGLMPVKSMHLRRQVGGFGTRRIKTFDEVLGII